ncbi:OmpA family protein [Vulcaniibacterium tengchongense]|uniref:DUF7927 domain-containing protein n=1 Tax=Vulcaniibacterium tengchongense TaxID=1273429 RepID=UPI0011C91EF2|nr:OmpA family protein [Vulcaniibacterium tengchongense]
MLKLETSLAACGRRFVAHALLLACAAFAAPQAWAQNAVNTATVATPSGVSDPDAGNDSATDRDPIVSVPSFDFCEANTVWNVGQSDPSGTGHFYRYAIGGSETQVPGLSLPVPGNLNALMIDPSNRRLLFISYQGGMAQLWAYDPGNGGWYHAAPAFAAPDLPRAGMRQDGVGFLVAGDNATPRVWRVAAAGAYGYTVSLVGNLAFDVAPANNVYSSGDVAFDAAGNGWLTVSQDLYKIDFDAAPLVAVRQQRPLLNGVPSSIQWAGVAFGPDGDLYVANNSAGGTQSRYYRLDLASGTLTPAAATAGNQARDLASCAFPAEPQPAQLQVEKTLALVNGAAPAGGARVRPGDTLTYRIAVRHAAGDLAATLFPGDVTDTLPANTSFVGGDFACSASACTNTATVNIPAGETRTLAFVVRVDDPLPGSAASIDNTVQARNVDCAAAGNDCAETTPVAPAVTVAKASNPASGTTVEPGRTIEYTLAVDVAHSATTAAVTLTDTLGGAQAFAGTPTVPAGGSCAPSGTTMVCTLAAGSAPGRYEFRYATTVAASATGSIGNAVVPGGDDRPTCAADACRTGHPIVATAVTVAKASVPASGTAVDPGSEIEYVLTVNVAHSATTDAVTLTDTPTGAQAFTGSPVVPAGGSCTPSGNAMVCTLAAGALPGAHEFRYRTRVDAAATGTLGNNVVPGGGDAPSCAPGACATTHTVVPAAVTVAKTANPGSGAVVNPGTQIEYVLAVTVANSATTGVVTLTDTLTGAQAFAGTPVVPAGGACAPSGRTMACTLAAGALPGTYEFRYRTAIDPAATGALGNNVVPGGDDDPACVPGACGTTHTITDSAVTVNKASNPGSGAVVNPGSEIEYVLTVNVANSATTDAVTLTDTLSGAQTYVGSPVVPAGGSCAPSGTALVCTLAAGALPGAYEFRYRTRIGDAATGSVGNTVVPSGGDDPTCGACGTTHPIVPPAVTVAKASNPGSGAVVNPGTEIEYVLTVTVADSATTGIVTLTDTLTGAQRFAGAPVLPAGGACTPSGSTLVCTLAAGALPGTYAFRYRAAVDPAATGALGNAVVPSGDDEPGCAPGGCATAHTVVPTAVTVAKSSAPASGTEVAPGDSIAYTLSVTVANSATTAPVTLTDTLSANQTLGTLPAGCSASGQVVTCTLPAGSLPGTYTFAYPATVDADATRAVDNAVVPSGADHPSCAPGACATQHPVVATAVSVSKSADPAPGSEVRPGDTITYTLAVDVAHSATTGAVVLTDTLSANQRLGALPAGCAGSGQVVTCTLAAGALPGRYTFVYPATVNADATGAVRNAVVPAGDDAPTCAGACTTEHPIVAPVVTVAKASDPASGATVNAGATIGYTLRVTVANSATTAPVALTDTLSGAHAFAGTPSVPDGGACSIAGDALQCTLAAGALPGTYEFRYATVVAAGASASGTIGNRVVASGGGNGEPICDACSTEHRIAAPVVEASKSASPGDGAEVRIGDTITYTLAVTVANAATTQPVVLNDTPGSGLSIGALPEGCAADAGAIVCRLPEGTVPGRYQFVYPAVVNADASGDVSNAVVASGGGGNQAAGCATCTTRHRVADAAQLRVVKQAGPREARIGDLVRYTLSIENVGAANVSDATLVDTPPPGFSYVADSLTVADADGVARLAGTHPIRVDRLDVRAGERATVQYLLRVGAGVRPGLHVNRAHVEDGGRTISNEASAEVRLAGDPLLDESLVVGTVYDDRDGDGWQDDAHLGEVRVQGGFAPGAYLPNSTTIDRGDGPRPLADASAPLLHGVELGRIDGRSSEAEPPLAHAVTISQTLRELQFTGDFVLTNAQGLTLRMDAAGTTRIERSGDAARGLTAAEPRVERRISRVEGGYRVDYVIGNAGIAEPGIPGVRIASVEGLLIETDRYGRYHLEGVAGGPEERGRNFILKVDPATLPPGARFTTENPRLRRITPGLPVRFDFGVQLPSGLVEGGRRTLELQLGEVMFDSGSAALRAEDAAVLDEMAAQLRQHGGGEVVIGADGASQALAYERALALRDALLDRLPREVALALSVELRAEPDDPDSTSVALGEAPVLGAVLFDTDSTRIKPEYAPLIARIAAEIERMQGGAVAVTGYADRRGAQAYNAGLALRRAKAVFDAIAAELSPGARSRLRVGIGDGPAASVGAHGR